MKTELDKLNKLRKSNGALRAGKRMISACWAVRVAVLIVDERI